MNRILSLILLATSGMTIYAASTAVIDTDFKHIMAVITWGMGVAGAVYAGMILYNSIKKGE